MQAVVTTLLDVVGLLLLAAGATFGLWEWVGPASLAVGGVVVLGGSMVAARMQQQTEED